MNEIKEMADQLRAMFPDATRTINLDANANGKTSLYVHGYADYASAMRDMRRIGGVMSHEHHHDPHNPWTALVGKAKGIEINLFCYGLPATCEIREKTIRVPKTQTVEVGEFIDMTVQEFVCLNTDDGEQAA